MIVPTGSAFLATSISGPSGSRSGSSLLRAGASEHILGHDGSNYRNDQRSNEQRELLHIHGEIASPCGPLEQPHTSDKLVKKPLGENRESPPRRSQLRTEFPDAFPPLGAVTYEHTNSEHAAGERHQHQELERAGRRKPQGESRGELDVAAAHHAGVEGAGEKDEDDCAAANCTAMPGQGASATEIQ